MDANSSRPQAMKRINYFDDSFDISHTNNYEIAIQFGLDGYSFCVNSLLSNKCVAIGYQKFDKPVLLSDLPSQLNSFLDSQAFLGRTFSKVGFVYTQVKSTLVPNELYTNSSSKVLFEYNHSLDMDETLEHQIIEGQNITQLFATPASLATVMVNKYKDVRFCHQSSGLFDALVNYSKQQKEARTLVLALFSGKVMDVIVASPSGVKLHNSYEVLSQTDAVYYLSYLYQQLELKQDKNALLLSGDIEENDELHKAILKVFPSSGFFTQLNKDYAFKVPKHRFINLINF